jgi:hypothetical protein
LRWRPDGDGGDITRAGVDDFAAVLRRGRECGFSCGNKVGLVLLIDDGKRKTKQGGEGLGRPRQTHTTTHTTRTVQAVHNTHTQGRTGIYRDV